MDKLIDVSFITFMAVLNMIRATRLNGSKLPLPHSYWKLALPVKFHDLLVVESLQDWCGLTGSTRIRGIRVIKLQTFLFTVRHPNSHLKRLYLQTKKKKKKRRLKLSIRYWYTEM